MILTDYAVRLMGGSSRFEGRVEVFHKTSSGGQWGTICNDYWGYKDAKVSSLYEQNADGVREMLLYGGGMHAGCVCVCLDIQTGDL